MEIQSNVPAIVSLPQSVLTIDDAFELTGVISNNKNPGQICWEASWESSPSPFTKLKTVGDYTFSCQTLGFSQLCEGGGGWGAGYSVVKCQVFQ